MATHEDLSIVREYIRNLDFTWVIKKITRPDPNIARLWTEKAAQEALEQYKNYLYLMRKHMGTEQLLPPSVEVDEMWHHHILDTRNYFKDCEAIFGHYQHHFPYFGMRSKDDEAALQTAFARTQEKYHEEYGEYLYEIEVGPAPQEKPSVP